MADGTRESPLDDHPKPAPKVSRKTVTRLLILGCVVYLFYLSSKIYSFLQTTKDVSVTDKRIQRVVASEELILQLTPKLKSLGISVRNLKLPEHHGIGLFADQVDLRDINDSQPASSADLPSVAVRTTNWPVESTIETNPRDAMDLWRPLFDTFAYVDHAKFYIIDGQFTGEQLDEFESHVGFTGLAFTRDGQWRSLHSKQTLRWSQSRDASEPSWKIAAWDTEHVKTEESPRRLFTEVLDEALPDKRDRRRARESIHENLLTPFLLEQKLPVAYYTPYFAPDSLSQHPSLSVVDIDRDGFDDLYVMARWGKNQLLHNQGDGTFREVAANWGLDIDGRSTGAVFADFDNDGDPDLLLGRSLERSQYLVNDNGRFVDRSEALVSGDLPYLVTAVSAADFNNDGLLDVYCCTYSASLLTERLYDESTPWPDEFLTAQQARKFRDLSKKAHRILDQVGPPNVLLVNRGDGRFEVAPDDHPLSLWRSSLQATWADYDQDGDADIYIANDFARGHLFRNDGAKGFVDASEAMDSKNQGAGMGAAWGDYDKDGQQDIYISNMYSKAGLRITAQVPGIDRRFVRFAEGNMMFRNLGDRFDNVAGLQPPSLLVAKAGWSWGGQYVDIDNDTDLDIYVCSGYYTVPDELSSDVDL